MVFIITCVVISILILSYWYFSSTKKIELNIITKSKELKELNEEINNIKNKIENEKKELSFKTQQIKEYNKLKELSQQSFSNYCDILGTQYESKEQEYEILSEELEKAYSQKQDDILKSISDEEASLADLRAFRAAAQQAQLKEKEIKDKLSFYCLPLKENDKRDIEILDSIKPRLSNPRVLSMLIWSTYFQKPMTTLCNNILGTSVVTGIYKITNQKNDMCYIGQSVNVATRFKQHAKCGLGIDTPMGNKLYKAMQEDGIQSFSWELLESCSAEKLDEKERYYIQLYDSCNYGYNSNSGNKNK